MTFTFTKTASTSTAAVGDTVEYTYCGQNTSDIPLEVVRLVDDRLGVVIELPDVETVVAPGESLCNTDLGLPVELRGHAADLGTTIVNHAVVTVRTQEDSPRSSRRRRPPKSTYRCHRFCSPLLLETTRRPGCATAPRANPTRTTRSPFPLID